jgi:cytochrome P450
MKDLHTIPTAPKALPLVGHLVSLLRDPQAFVKSLPAHGGLVQVKLGPFTLVVLCDPELTRRALIEDRIFDKGGPLYDSAREVLRDGLVTCPHSVHRRLRRLTQPAFHAARLPGYAQAMTTCIDEVTGSWRAGQVLDVLAAMKSITSQVTATTLFSSALSPAGFGHLLNDAEVITDGVFRRLLLVPPLDRLPTPKNRSYLSASTRLHETCGQIIAQRRADGTDYGDLLSALMAAHDPESGGRGMTDAEISDMILTFFLAGTETTAAALTWALDLLARHPKIEQRLQAEVDTVLCGAPATHADLPRLELTGRVIAETLRLYPPGWVFTRTVTADTRLGRHLLPAGTSVVYSPYLIHHHPDLFKDPEKFDPDRWDSERPRPPRHAVTHFGAGARKCIGDTFAVIEATLALATITSRCQLHHLPNRTIRPTLGGILSPRGLSMRVTPRGTAARMSDT